MYKHDQINILSIPAVTSHYGEREFELSVKRRAAFLAAISRKDVDVNNIKFVLGTSFIVNLLKHWKKLI